MLLHWKLKLRKKAKKKVSYFLAECIHVNMHLHNMKIEICIIFTINFFESLKKLSLKF